MSEGSVFSFLILGFGLDRDTGGSLPFVVRFEGCCRRDVGS